MASSKIEKRFAALEERVATLETLIASAMADDVDDDAVTPAPADGDEPTKP